MSRRAAREAERRAAEALAEKQPHPSGVVDFEAHDFSPEFAPDQEFNVGDTQDIWAALTRGQRPEPAQTGDLAAFRSGIPEAPAEPARDDSGVNGDLLDRVREAVLRRAPEAPQPAVRPTAVQPPAAFQQLPAAPSPFPADVGYDGSALTRRQRREREVSAEREDGLPAELFPDAHHGASVPMQQPQPAGFEGYDYEEDGYYDEPYLPEPTIAIPRQGIEAEPAVHATNPIGLPQAFSEPTGDDSIRFSSPVTVVPAEHRDQWGAAQADPAFIAPRRGWSDQDERDDEPEAFGVQAYEPRAFSPGPIPAQPVSPFVEPQPHLQSAQFRAEQMGPPSEVTDLAGFEALIRKARQQPKAPEPVTTGPALAWADDQEEVQEGFTGLLSRSVQGSHGSANALILPNDPQLGLTQAVSANGDIFITGSMNLPRSLSTTGASDGYDSQDIDRLYEASQDEPASGVAPVKASRAVSGAPHDRGFAKAPRRGGNLMPTLLAIIAGAMAVGVVTLLVGSWVLKLF